MIQREREREKENVRVREKERAGRLTESEIERPRVVGNMYEFVFWLYTRHHHLYIDISAYAYIHVNP